MFDRARYVAFVCLLYAATASAQDAGTASAGESPEARDASVPTPAQPGLAVAVFIPKKAEPDPEQLHKTHQLYDAARKALGGEHVLLTAATYLGKQCSKHGLKDCGRLEAGVAALISVPLVGAGGSHGFDWYPVLQTKDATDAYQAFESQAKEYVALVDASQAADLDARLVLRTLEDAARSLFDQAFDDDASRWEVVKSGRVCLAQLRKLRELGESATGTRGDTKQALAQTLGSAWRANLSELKKHTDAEREHDDASGVEGMYRACKTLGDLVVRAEDPREQLIALARLLKTYWRSLALAAPLTRHAALLGPSVGVPLTQDPTDLVLAGALLELGHPKYSQFLRLGISGGVQVRYAHVAGPPGWYVGLALSGALGDDLFHRINGGLAAARQLTAGQ